MKTAELTEIRNELYNAMPSGQIDAFELIKVISNHLNRLDRFIESYASHPPMSTEQYVLDNGMGTDTQYSSGAIHSLGEFPATKTMSAEQVEAKDLIIHGLQEGAESWKAEYDNCRALLQELVSLKVMKENLYKGNPDGKEYAERKPKAWEAAKQFLSTYQHEVFSTTPSVKDDVVKTPHPDKPFIVANVREILDQYDKGDDENEIGVSYSRMVEMFNDAVFQWMAKQESVKADGFETVKALWSTLTDEQRLGLPCCRGCGSLDTSCHCLNDE